MKSIVEKLGIYFTPWNDGTKERIIRCIINSIEYIQSPENFDLINPWQAMLFDQLNDTLIILTGKTWEEVKEIINEK